MVTFGHGCGTIIPRSEFPVAAPYADLSTFPCLRVVALGRVSVRFGSVFADMMTEKTAAVDAYKRREQVNAT